MIFPKEEVLKYLDCVKSLKKVCPLIDIHVSPFEVIFNSFHYVPNPHHEGVHSLDSGLYRPASAESLRVETLLSESSRERLDSVPAKLSLMLYRKFYAHIGPRVLGDHMRLSGISRSLLLPVVQTDSEGEEQLRLMFKIYGGDRRFILGYCVPNAVSNKDILTVVKAAVSKYRIGAIKLHPNITEINLSTVAGKNRVENILEACRVTGLPLVVHGGLSPVLKNPNSRGYAALSNLCQIDWSITSACILSTHSNVMVDISALDLGALCLILEKVDRDRIVFGSDAFYFPQWSAVVKLLHALKATVSDTEEAFIKIAGKNPARNVFQEQELC
jgi:hypothetical protein